MNIVDFGKFNSSFGLVKSPSKVVVESFLSWQQKILPDWGFELKLEKRQGKLGDALIALCPRTAPIVTRYLFWPVDENWTLYFDNGVSGTDAGPPSVLSSRLGVDAIRVVMADEVIDPVSGQVTQYPATILEFYSNGVERRHIFVANDGGKWKFGELGEPFLFENMAAYKVRSIKDRFTNAMLHSYLKELGVNLSNANSVLTEPDLGYLLTKHGKMPASYKEFKD
ncbi:hypothetical protein H8K52_18005 [Undibacterium seohonense]|uniref:Uncharacterized protein n=2 Tax=Undibacterium seohonense TaxID=1344950 RepID=A0ABR6X8P6_9BURK|nr:hypothetical protein [Undibacterium seohonense]